MERGRPLLSKNYTNHGKCKSFKFLYKFTFSLPKYFKMFSIVRAGIIPDAQKAKRKALITDKESDTEFILDDSMPRDYRRILKLKKVIKARWILFSLWVVITFMLTIFQPNINPILAKKGQDILADNSPSKVANSMLSKMSKSKGSDDILVFYDKNKITDSEMNQIQDGIKALNDSKTELGVSDIIDPFSMSEAKDSLISKDGTTLFISFKLDKGTNSVDTMLKRLGSKFSNVKVEHYFSGSDFINNDYQKKCEDGVTKSAILTIIFILVILVIMFRSVITPLVSLVAVVFTYLCTMGITSQLIVNNGFPVTSFTQVLVILILFGIGTDYNILLFNRFKEELSHNLSVDDAIVKTYKTAGKTIAFSILTVLIAFFSLLFSETKLFQSGIVIVIAVAILLLEILTLTPFIMKVLGKKIFWPSKNVAGHKQSKLWDKVSTASTKHPIISVAVIALLILPMLFTYKEQLNFDTIKELGNSCASSKGFNLITDHFGKGRAMPTTVVIQSNKSLNNNESLAVIDNITERIKYIKGVKQVASVTQPQSKQIKGFYIDSQTKSVAEGLTQTQNGVNQIYDGLKLASDKLGSADFSKVSQMVDGTAHLQTGETALADGLKHIQVGISGGPNGSQSISSGLAAIETNLTKMSGGVKQLANSYDQLQAGYTKMGASYQGAAQALLGVKSSLVNMQSMITVLGNDYPNCKSDKNYISLKQTVDSLSSSLAQITPEGIQTLNSSYNQATRGFTMANQNLTSISTGLSQMADGVKKLESGLGKASDGISVIVTNMNQVSAGLGQMKSGQEQLVSGLNGFSTFGSKLSDVTTGLKQISDGLGQTSDFLAEYNTNKTFYIPKKALNSADLKKLMNNFMSSNRQSTKLQVVLTTDPYSKASMNTIQQINEVLSNGLKGTTLSSAKYGVSGPSATASDMNKALSRDLNKTTVILLICVLIVLILVTRSIWAPICITASLMGAYYVAMFVMNYIFLNLMGLSGISSFVPFMTFLIIVALGVDYSIFLMMRYKEYPNLSPKEAIVLASKNTGEVVMSACLILGGTFATLMPSGMTLLIQWATGVITGLAILCFILLPIFLPAMIVLPEKLKKIFSHKENMIASKEDAA